MSRNDSPRNDSPRNDSPQKGAPSYDLRELLGDLCNGTLDETRGSWLNALLVDDGQARILYANYMAMHAGLYAEGGDLSQAPGYDRLGEQQGVAPPSSTPGHTSTPAPAITLGHPSTLGHPVPRRFLFAALAALVTMGASSSLVTYLIAGRAGERSDPFASPPASIAASAAPAESSQRVARVTGTHNCVWDTEFSPVSYGAHLETGQELRLLEGIAEITFHDGATLLLEGPSLFVVRASDQLALTSGRLAAVVPHRARGFQVHTPALDVFEVGTEFGLLAHESGATELHVFNGLVRADVLDGEGQALERLELNATEAARINPRSTTVLEFPAQDAQFVRSLLPSSGPHDGLLAYEGFRYPEGPLSAQNGGFGWAGPWFDISVAEEAGDSNRVLPGSLAVEGIVPAGNRGSICGQRNRIRRSLATSVGGVFDAAGLVENQDGMRLAGRDGNVIYLSFLQRVSAVDDGFYGLELHRGDGNGNRVLCVGHGADGTGYGVTSNVNVYGKENFPSLGRENSDANFFVIKISFGVGHRDVVEVFRNPTSLRDEQSCRATTRLTGNFAFDRISLANFDGSKTFDVDEIRVGTHFLAVTGRWGAHSGRLMRRMAVPNRVPAPAWRQVGRQQVGWEPVALGPGSLGGRVGLEGPTSRAVTSVVPGWCVAGAFLAGR